MEFRSNRRRIREGRGKNPFEIQALDQRKKKGSAAYLRRAKIQNPRFVSMTKRKRKILSLRIYSERCCG
jgi:hypothetical protein